MSISRFKFVSPGVFVKEIDKSQTPRLAPVMGPTIIGRSEKGPMMRPIRVNSYADFVEVFGEPTPGGFSGDIWRAGVTLGPTYGAYAAKAYLASNGPVTFVRLAGYQNENASGDDASLAGWKLKNDLNTASVSANGGAYGLFIAPIESSSADTYSMPETTGSLAAIFYVNEGVIGLYGKSLVSSTNDINGSGSVWVRSTTHGSKEFTLKIRDNAGVTETVTFNFDNSSKNFIRNKFNTNPTALSTITNGASAQKDYFLGETFESYVNKYIKTKPTVGSYAATILALKGTSASAANYKKPAAKSKTGWIVGQHKGDKSEFIANSSGKYNVQELFRFWSLSEGEWNQNNIKISISDIKPSPSRFEKYGTFTVTVRKINDDDVSQQPLEVYTGLNLNPNSPNYISKRIGNMYMEWDPDRKLFTEYGTYPNSSKYIRVEVSDAIELGAGGDNVSDLLPFGFYGPRKFKSFNASGSVSQHSVIDSSNFVRGAFHNSAYSGSDTKISGNAAYTASLDFPELLFVVSSSTDSTANTLDRVYWGIKTRIDGTKLFDQSITDILRVKPYGISDSSSELTYSTLFSLDEVMYSGSILPTEITSGLGLQSAFWKEGSRVSALSITSKTDFESNGGIAGSNFQRIARFTLPLEGGYNGFDIVEKEPLSEGSGHSLTDDSDETTSYIYNSIKTAIDAVSDPEVVETNLMLVPGIQNPKLTNYLIETCEQRGDALAIIDIQGDYKSSWESTQEVKPNVTTAVSLLKARNLNSSYGCCFFPAVLARDNSANALLGMPSSVIALGVMGSSAAATELWFAPAGFNRGGLSSGAAGFPVVGVKTKLTSKDRDNLYEVNINPIASFPAEGIVVFGQKTLQAVPSALDRINVRRLMIYVKKEVSRFANTVLFDPNVQVTWARFLNLVNPFLQDVQSRFGLTEFRVVLDENTTTPELIDRNIVYAKIFLKPARAIEFIALDFIITRTGASFDD